MIKAPLATRTRGEKRGIAVTVRLQPSDHKRLAKMAKASGKTLAGLVRFAALTMLLGACGAVSAPIQAPTSCLAAIEACTQSVGDQLESCLSGCESQNQGPECFAGCQEYTYSICNGALPASESQAFIGDRQKACQAACGTGDGSGPCADQCWDTYRLNAAGCSVPTTEVTCANPGCPDVPGACAGRFGLGTCCTFEAVCAEGLACVGHTDAGPGICGLRTEAN